MKINDIQKTALINHFKAKRKDGHNIFIPSITTLDEYKNGWGTQEHNKEWIKKGKPLVIVHSESLTLNINSETKDSAYTTFHLFDDYGYGNLILFKDDELVEITSLEIIIAGNVIALNKEYYSAPFALYSRL